jgi:predicted RNA binding protein YcfA (HicA-like mRNA interferase family)
LHGLPVVSGKDLLRLLDKLGYTIVRQRGSHVQLRCITPSGEHMITVPLHDEIAPGTLHDILTRVAVRKGILKEELIIMLSRKRKGR